MASEVRHGDCLEVVRSQAAQSVDLVYVDPPFFTQKTHSLVTRDRTTKFEFSDEWKSRVEYIEFLRVRVKEFRRVLKATGSLFFHCDTNASHHIRCLLDDAFGEAMFRSEIIWHYRRWSNSQRNPMPSHQTIFFYTKTEAYQYHQLFDDYSPSTNVDQILQRRQRDEHGKAVYARDGSGNVIHDGHKKGVPIADVWDIPLLNPKAKERVGYPTQKPILLLERIIRWSHRRATWCSTRSPAAAQRLSRLNCSVATRWGLTSPPKPSSWRRNDWSSHLRHHPNCCVKDAKPTSSLTKRRLAYLHGLPIVPVQRNRGIDAILKIPPGENPVLIRVQRRGESLADAAKLLHSAGQSKQPATLILVVTDSRQPAGLFNLLPPNVLLVDSTASELNERLADRGIGKLNY
jgi:site-specific DNA-methyltransferase (adenine-specific)